MTREYWSRKPDEIDMKRGDIVDVLEKNLNGWWLVRIGERTGKVPAVYLRAYKGSDPVKSAMSAWELFGNNANEADTNEEDDDDDQVRYLPPRDDFIDDSRSLQTSHSNLSVSWSSSLLSSSGDVWYVVQDYEDKAGDVIGELRKGQRVCVLDKENASGWWLVRLDDATEGWAPSAYLSVIYEFSTAF